MESNKLREIFADRSINITDFARKNGLNPQTLHSVLKTNSRIERTGIGTFIKIAHGLGMTADELSAICFGDE